MLEAWRYGMGPRNREPHGPRGMGPGVPEGGRPAFPKPRSSANLPLLWYSGRQEETLGGGISGVRCVDQVPKVSACGAHGVGGLVSEALPWRLRRESPCRAKAPSPRGSGVRRFVGVMFRRRFFL